MTFLMTSISRIPAPAVRGRAEELLNDVTAVRGESTPLELRSRHRSGLCFRDSLASSASRRVSSSAVYFHHVVTVTPFRHLQEGR